MELFLVSSLWCLLHLVLPVIARPSTPALINDSYLSHLLTVSSSSVSFLIHYSFLALFLNFLSYPVSYLPFLSPLVFLLFPPCLSSFLSFYSFFSPFFSFAPSTCLLSPILSLHHSFTLSPNFLRPWLLPSLSPLSPSLPPSLPLVPPPVLPYQPTFFSPSILNASHIWLLEMK